MSIESDQEGDAVAVRSSEAEARFRLFLDESPDACVILDGELRYEYFNRAAAILSGQSLDELKGKPLPILQEEGSGLRLSKYREVLSDGLARTLEQIKPGGVFGDRIFRVRVFKVGAGLGLIWTETTEFRLAEARLLSAQKELRALTDHLVEVREEERKGLARELHDELGQSLTAVEMELRHLARLHGANGETANAGAKERIGELLVLVNQSIRSVQRICSELRPAILDKLGLKAALEWLVDNCETRSTMTASAKLDFREEEIGPKASTAIFRIAQEAMLNVVRHARASSVEMSLRRTDRALELVVADDGIGVAEERLTAPDSFGIQGIRERARAFGGSVSIAGEPGAGTSLVVAIPLPHEGRIP